MDKYGIIGYPLGHSYSKGYFNEKFRNEGIDAVYENFEINSINKIAEVLAQNPDLKGLNVTSPFKERIIEYLDETNPEVRKINACNVIKITRVKNSLNLKGFNSDYIAFRMSIEPLLEPYHQAALILGTGGAASAVQYALKELGLQTMLVSRYDRPGTVNYKMLKAEHLEDYNVIVNATPCGMYPKVNDCPNIPYEGIDNHTLMYDLTYNPEETLFLRKGRERGAITKNGIEMHLLQAFESWRIWNQ